MANVAFYWRESTNDGIYALGGMNSDPRMAMALHRHAGRSARRVSGRRHLSVAGSYSIFTAGAFIEDTGASETIHFVGTEILYRF